MILLLLFFDFMWFVDCDFVPCRSDNLVWVHGGSSEGRMGHEPAEAGYQRHRLGHPELWEVTMIAGWVGSPLTGVCLILWASCDLEAELSALFHGCRFCRGFACRSKDPSPCCMPAVCSGIKLTSLREHVLFDAVQSIIMYLHSLSLCVFYVIYLVDIIRIFIIKDGFSSDIVQLWRTVLCSYVNPVISSVRLSGTGLAENTEGRMMY